MDSINGSIVALNNFVSTLYYTCIHYMYNNNPSLQIAALEKKDAVNNETKQDKEEKEGDEVEEEVEEKEQEVKEGEEEKEEDKEDSGSSDSDSPLKNIMVWYNLKIAT